ARELGELRRTRIAHPFAAAVAGDDADNLTLLVLELRKSRTQLDHAFGERANLAEGVVSLVGSERAVGHGPESSMRWRLGAWIAFGMLVSAVAYASRFTAGPPERDALYKWSTAIGEVFVFAVIITVTLAITGSQRQLLALRRPYSWRRAAALAVPVFVVVFVAISALDRALHGAREQGLVPKHWEP